MNTIVSNLATRMYEFFFQTERAGRHHAIRLGVFDDNNVRVGVVLHRGESVWNNYTACARQGGERQRDKTALRPGSRPNAHSPAYICRVTFPVTVSWDSRSTYPANNEIKLGDNTRNEPVMALTAFVVGRAQRPQPVQVRIVDEPEQRRRRCSFSGRTVVVGSRGRPRQTPVEQVVVVAVAVHRSRRVVSS